VCRKLWGEVMSLNRIIQGLSRGRAITLCWTGNTTTTTATWTANGTTKSRKAWRRQAKEFEGYLEFLTLTDCRTTKGPWPLLPLRNYVINTPCAPCTWHGDFQVVPVDIVLLQATRVALVRCLGSFKRPSPSPLTSPSLSSRVLQPRSSAMPPLSFFASCFRLKLLCLRASFAWYLDPRRNRESRSLMISIGAQ